MKAGATFKPPFIPLVFSSAKYKSYWQAYFIFRNTCKIYSFLRKTLRVCKNFDVAHHLGCYFTLMASACCNKLFFLFIYLWIFNPSFVSNLHFNRLNFFRFWNGHEKRLTSSRILLFQAEKISIPMFFEIFFFPFLVIPFQHTFTYLNYAEQTVVHN